MQRESLAPGKQRVEGRRPHTGRRDDLGRHDRIARPDLEAERESTARERGSDPSETDDAEARTADSSQGPCGGAVPAAGANIAVERHDPTQQREEKCERRVGHLLDAVVRNVAHPHPAFRGGTNVDVVEADAAGGDHSESRKPVELGWTDRLIGADQQAGDVVPLPGGSPELDVGACPVEQLPDQLVGEVRVSDEDSHRRARV